MTYRGNSSSKILLIGEAPGEEEDKTGKPFVGPAGKLLDSHLRMCGVTGKDVVIVNAIKCRPPDNRKPTKKELSICTDYLWEQIRLLRPKWIVLLGSTAFDAVFRPKRQVKITFFAGKFLDPIAFSKDVENRLCGARVFVQFHPSYCLHNPNMVLPIINNWRVFFQEVAKSVPRK